MTFNLKQWRSRLEITQEKAAELLGVYLVTYTNCENGVHPFSKRVELACEFFYQRFPASMSYSRHLIEAIDKYREHYLKEFGKLPEGKHSIYTSWTTNKYQLIDLTPDNPSS
jgi:DNA-binding XRE family transcriptional regulator